MSHRDESQAGDLPWHSALMFIRLWGSTYLASWEEPFLWQSQLATLAPTHLEMQRSHTDGESARAGMAHTCHPGTALGATLSGYVFRKGTTGVV